MSVNFWLGFLAILLGVVTVVVAALGVGFGIAAIYGWRSLKEELRARVKKLVKKEIRSFLQSNQVEDIVRRETRSAAESALLPVVESFKVASAPQDKNSLAEPYPQSSGEGREEKEAP